MLPHMELLLHGIVTGISLNKNILGDNLAFIGLYERPSPNIIMQEMCMINMGLIHDFKVSFEEFFEIKVNAQFILLSK